MDKFSKNSIEKLNVSCNKYYVYRLIDPRTYETFYVGKGCGNRVFQHAKNAQSLKSKKNDEGEDEISLKIEQINSIINSGKEVICLIHRWGLTEAEAYEVEAALIDAYQGLTNIQSGHGSDYGVISVEDFEAQANTQEYSEPAEDYIIIKTTERAIEVHGNLYEATRRCWRAKLDKVQKYKYVLSVVGGIVKETYEVKPEEWSKRGERIEFVGKVATNPNITALKGKLIPSEYRQRGAANPFLYKK